MLIYNEIFLKKKWTTIAQTASIINFIRCILQISLPISQTNTNYTKTKLNEKRQEQNDFLAVPQTMDCHKLSGRTGTD